MSVEWTKLADGVREECASVSCGHSPAHWRMDAGGTGSFFCDPCKLKIANPKSLGTPLSELSGRPGEHGFDEFCRIAETWGY